MEAKDIIESTEREYATLQTAVHGLDEARLAEVWLGTWGVREIMAHVAGWQREMAPALERLARGEEPYAPGTYDDFERWNARFVDERRGMKTADILAEADVSHRDLLRAARLLSDAQLAAGQPARGLLDGVGGEHYREHAAQISAWRGDHGPR